MNIKFEKSNVSEGTGLAHKTSETANNTNNTENINITYRLMVQDKNGFMRWYDRGKFDAAKIEKNIDKMCQSASQGHMDGEVVFFRDGSLVGYLKVEYNWVLKSNLVVFGVTQDFVNPCAEYNKFYLGEGYDVDEGILWECYFILKGEKGFQNGLKRVKQSDNIVRERIARAQAC